VKTPTQQTYEPATTPKQKKPAAVSVQKAPEAEPAQTAPAIKLAPAEVARLDSLVNATRGLAKLELILVTGHAAGPEIQPNAQWRSEDYASFVRDYFVARGVSRYKIEIFGMGKTQPTPGISTPNDSANNRVEIAVKGLRRDDGNVVNVTLAETVLFPMQ
jgi:hypothetical protein